MCISLRSFGSTRIVSLSASEGSEEGCLKAAEVARRSAIPDQQKHYGAPTHTCHPDELMLCSAYGGSPSASKTSPPISHHNRRKVMSPHPEHRLAHTDMNAPRLYPSELLPSLQSLLATLADIDFEHESDVETI